VGKWVDGMQIQMNGEDKCESQTPATESDDRGSKKGGKGIGFETEWGIKPS
jgi:hypothetical protein